MIPTADAAGEILGGVLGCHCTRRRGHLARLRPRGLRREGDCPRGGGGGLVTEPSAGMLVVGAGASG